MLKAFADALRSGEDFLLERLFSHASVAEYSYFTSSTEEERRATLASPTTALIEYITTYDRPDSFHIDELRNKNPAAACGVIEAKQHRERGVRFETYLGLTKLVRQSFFDLITEMQCSKEAKDLSAAMTLRFFDKFELGFATEWLRSEESDLTREFIKKTSDLITVVDGEGRFTYVNPVAKRVLGLNNVDAIGRLAFDFVHADDRNRTKLWFEECIQNGLEQTSFENRQVNQDTGKTSDMMWTVDFNYDTTGAVVGVRSIGHDITRRKQAEEALRESEQHFRDVVHNSEAGYFFIDRNGHFQDVNDAWIQLYKYASRDEVIGLHFASIQRPEDVEPAKELVAEIMRGNQASLRGEFSRLCKDGSTGYHSFSARPVAKSGQIIGIEGFIIDTTSRRQAEDAKRESEERFRLMMHQSPSVVELYDLDGLQIDVNGAYEALWGFPASHTVNSFNVLKSKEVEATGLLEYIKKAYAGEAVTLPEYEFDSTGETEAKGQGRTRWLSTKIYPLKDTQGTVKHVVITHEDISDRKYAETERLELQRDMQHAQKLESLGVLAGGIAHDFNNLLQALFASVELALMEVEEHGEVYSYLCEAQNAAHRASNLVHQILTFSRRGEQETKAVNLFSIVRETSQLLRATLPATIEIHEDLDASCGAVFADPTQLHQIIMNLGTNAFHAMAESGGVLELKLKRLEVATTSAEVTLVEPGPYLELMVSDSGSGMDAKLLDRIFEPYFTTRRPGEGTGLGLAVVHGIVASLGGAIIVTSAPGAGAQFRILLPQVKATAKTVSGAHKAQPTGSEHVLLVDDEAAILRLGVATLNSLGYEVTTANSAEEALDLFEQNPERFDFVLTDQTMKGISGLDLAEKLIPIRPDLPVVLCTGRGAMVDRDRADTIGIRTILSKPFDRSTLALTLRRVLGDVSSH